nr:tripartite motif-containing protein 16-like isoform X2 [Misgurnus anguillicaudatus]
MKCITKCWNQEDQKGIYSCPQCRQTFSPRPVLGKNTMMAEMVEKLIMTKLPAAGPGDVECDVCIKIKYKAVKSCLVCLNSYCQNHLEQHESLFKGKKHSLMDANGRLKEMICHEHNKLLEVFCRTDQKCICMTCMMDQHENHETVKTAAERTEKQKPLEQTLTMLKQRINQRMKELEKLRVGVEDHKRSAKSAMKSSEMMFTELIRSIERCRSEVTQLIRDVVCQAEEHFVRLEQQIDDLRRKEASLQELLHTDDHIHFLQSFQSLCAPPETSDLPSLTVSSVITFDHVGESVSQLKTQLEDLCKEEIKKITHRVRGTQIISKTREEFLQYPCQLNLEDIVLDDDEREIVDLEEPFWESLIPILKTPAPYDENKSLRRSFNLDEAEGKNKPPPSPPTSFPNVPMGGPGAGRPVNIFSRRTGPDEQVMEESVPDTGAENTEQKNATVPQVPAQPPAQGAPPTKGVTFHNPPTGGMTFYNPPKGGMSFYNLPSGGMSFYNPPSGGMPFYNPPSGGVPFYNPPTGGVAFYNTSQFAQYVPVNRGQPIRLRHPHPQ